MSAVPEGSPASSGGAEWDSALACEVSRLTSAHSTNCGGSSTSDDFDGALNDQLRTKTCLGQLLVSRNRCLSSLLIHIRNAFVAKNLVLATKQDNTRTSIEVINCFISSQLVSSLKLLTQKIALGVISFAALIVIDDVVAVPTTCFSRLRDCTFSTRTGAVELPIADTGRDKCDRRSIPGCDGFI